LRGTGTILARKNLVGNQQRGPKMQYKSRKSSNKSNVGKQGPLTGTESYDGKNREKKERALSNKFFEQGEPTIKEENIEGHRGGKAQNVQKEGAPGQSPDVLQGGCGATKRPRAREGRKEGGGRVVY